MGLFKAGDRLGARAVLAVTTLRPSGVVSK